MSTFAAIALPVAVHFDRMAKTRDTNEPTEPKNFRLRASVIEAVEKYKAAHPLRPTLTQIIEAALIEYVANHGHETKSKR